MKPSLTFLVHSRNGDATALAEVGRRRATSAAHLLAHDAPSTTASLLLVCTGFVLTWRRYIGQKKSKLVTEPLVLG